MNEYRTEIKKLYIPYLKAAKDKFKRDNLKTFKDTTGNWVIIKNGHAGIVSHFEIPKSYIDKTINGDEPLSDQVLKVVVKTIDNAFNGKGDFRGPSGNFITLPEWVKEFKKNPVPRAWGKNYGELFIGGKGQNPSLDDIINKTHGGLALSYLGDDILKNALIAIGITGISYYGGIRVGGYVRGGGGITHTSYVFWDDDYINSRKVISEPQQYNPVNPKTLRSVRGLPR